MKRVLVTGGAGYIGSITSKILSEFGYTPIIFDNLEFGHRAAVKDFDMIEGDLRSPEDIQDAIKTVKPDAVIHFAAYIQFGESMDDPLKYFENNVLGSLNLFKAMLLNGVDKLVFSSTAAVYGLPKEFPITENTPTVPINPYGQSKLMVENMLQWMASQGLNSIRLRYFNVAGAMLDGSMGSDHHTVTHITPLVIQAALGRRDSFTIYGDDYETIDGTCVRDYIHVVDLARVHVRALEHLPQLLGTEFYNAGVGKGYSNKQLVEMVKEVSGVDFNVIVGDRRPGDPDELYTDSTRLQTELGWKPEYGLREIIESAWKWHKNNPNGY